MHTLRAIRAGRVALDRERGSAAAGAGGVRVLDHKARADQFFGIVDHGIGKEGQRYGIDQNALCALFQHQIIVACIIQPDVILKAGTTAAFDSHAQRPCIAGGFGNFSQSRECAVGYAGGKRQRCHVKTHIIAASVSYKMQQTNLQEQAQSC